MHDSTTQIDAVVIRHKREFRLRWVLLAVAAALLFFILYPPSFRFALRRVLVLAARTRGAHLGIGQVRGSLFTPVSLYDIQLTSTTRAGTARKVSAARVDAIVNWKRLLFHGAPPWIDKLVVDQLDTDIGLPIHPPGAGASSGRGAGFDWLPSLLPSNLELLRSNLVVRLKDSSAAFTGVHLTASEDAPGVLEADRIEFRQPALTKTFTAVKGTTSLEGSKLTVGGLKLGEGLQIETLSADLGELADGKAAISFDVSAFQGKVLCEMLLAPVDGRVHFEAAGSFSHISLEDVAAFVDSTEPAGGMLKDGKFTFRGSPREIDKATVVVRLEATDFLWGKRRWNSLVAGATMSNSKLAINEFHLKQSHNELTLTGQAEIPPAGKEWWQCSFNLDVAANIQNLTELSALFGPGFGESAGRMTIDGLVSGDNEYFTGSLKAAGSQLSWRDAPLDSFNASIDLKGNELDVTSLQFAHKKDFLRGGGVVNILGEKRYWGELKASIADLALYSAFFVEPIAPRAFAGGLFLDWSGDGTVNAHSGAFRAQLKDIRPLVVTDSKFHPLDFDLEGTYALENVYFSKFTIADAATSLSAQVATTPASLTLQSVKIQHDGENWLQGDAVLPLSIWNLWQARPWNKVIDVNGPLKVDAAAHDLRLHEVALLTGHDLPIGGNLTMKLAASGSLSGLTATGDLHIAKAHISAPSLPLALNGVNADIALQGQQALIQSFAGEFASSTNAAADDFNTTGKISWNNPRDPAFDLAFQGKKIWLAAGPRTSVTANVDLKLQGASTAPVVTGSAQLLGVYTSGSANLETLVAPGPIPLPPISLAPPNWTVQLACSGNDTPLFIGSASGKASFDLALNGPAITGRVDLSSITDNEPTRSQNNWSLQIDSGAVYFENPDPANPILSLRCSTTAWDRKFDILVTGPMNQRQIFVDSDPPLTRGQANAVLQAFNTPEWSVVDPTVTASHDVPPPSKSPFDGGSTFTLPSIPTGATPFLNPEPLTPPAVPAK